MKIEYPFGDKIVKIIACDNLEEYFTEFKKYRNSLSKEELAVFPVDFFQSNSFFADNISKKMIIYFHYPLDLPNESRYDKATKQIRLELDFSIVNLESEEWQFQREKINKVIREIWTTEEAKNYQGLDLNWPVTSQPNNGNKKEQAKKIIKEVLQGDPKIDSSPAKAEEQFKSHIGFKKEKEKFKDYVELYLSTKGEFCPNKEIICYSGAPGMGKTTFVQTLNQAMGRGELQIISCAGLKEFKDYSILGDENKPSLVARAIKESGCKNPIILLDELEKIKDEQIQRDLITLFRLYKNEEGAKKKEYQSKKLFDKYYQMEIELDHITFFATVNYPQDLVPLLKKEVKMRSLEDYTYEEKVAILKLKKQEIEASIKKIYGEEKEIIPEEIITELPKHIKEAGVRQAERALQKIKKEYITAKETNQPFSLGNPKEWLKKNVLDYQENFYPKPKHWLLFSLWSIIWVLLLVVIVKKVILRKESQKSTENE